MKMHSEIASIFIILLLIMGCYSYNLIKKEDIEKIEEYDEVKITTLVDKVYYLHNVEIQGSVLKGYKYIIQPYREKRVEEVVIHFEEIKIIKFSQYDYDIEKIEEYDEVKITTLVDKVYYLHNVEIQGSVLKGYKYIIQPYREKRVEEVVIPTDQIKKIEVDKFNPAITALTVVLIIGIPIAALAIALANADYH